MLILYFSATVLKRVREKCHPKIQIKANVSIFRRLTRGPNIPPITTQHTAAWTMYTMKDLHLKPNNVQFEFKRFCVLGAPNIELNSIYLDSNELRDANCAPAQDCYKSMKRHWIFQYMSSKCVDQTRKQAVQNPHTMDAKYGGNIVHI